MLQGSKSERMTTFSKVPNCQDIEEEVVVRETFLAEETDSGMTNLDSSVLAPLEHKERVGK